MSSIKMVDSQSISLPVGLPTHLHRILFASLYIPNSPGPGEIPILCGQIMSHLHFSWLNKFK